MWKKEVLKIIEKAAIDGAKMLDLSGQGIKSLPAEIGELTKLQYLNLGFNKLAKLPVEIGRLANLQKLYLRGNQLTSVPAELGKLTNLVELYLSGNQLTSVTAELGKLTNLKRLSLHENQLKSVPAVLGKLTNLTHLYLYGNQLMSVSVELRKLINLTLLNLGRNQLTSVPAELGNLTNLEDLYLYENKLRSLPVELGRLTKLEILDLKNNPLESPPPEVVNKGVKAIRDYLRQLDKAGKDYLYEGKLLIVGEAGAGKTSLGKKIEDENYELREDQESTPGIDVIEWHFGMEGGHDFRVNMWDFGGQEIYHSTHQFFLTKRSLYALVADDRKEDTDFNYWLNVVELLSDNSPVLIVKNEKQDRHREINESALRGQFSNIKEILATNLATNRGLKEIKKEIRHHMSKLPHVGTELPKTWVKVREALEKDKRNYISVDEYFDICERNGFKEKNDKLQLSGYLHDLGVCLHFQDDMLLRKTVILKPDWGTDAVYEVLHNVGVMKNKGRFSQSDVDKIWAEPRFAGMHAELLRLMINFKLCYEIKETGEYIAPELLTKNQPGYDWDEGKNLILRYTYEFMPKGIVTQFIVGMHPFIVDQDLVWREGVILEKDETRAEVIENYGKREIRIRVVGMHRKELMTIVTYELDKIHDTYKRLKHSKWIPCNCEVCKGSQEPHFYQYDTLRDFMSKGYYKIQCQKKPDEMVNVRGLIDDVMVLTRVKGTEKRFRIALSFSGERRKYVGKVAESLVGEFGEEQVFYDKNFEAELARLDLDTYLQGIYHDDSELIVVFLCAEYEKKEWCGLEWRAIRDLIKKKKAWEIMFVRFDDTEIAGMYSIDGYVSAEGREPEEVAERIIERYRMNEQRLRDEKRGRR
ncbi:MAG: TIR domain-containing protein [Phycisphaerae bacterium]|nr:TIR domain-containing protein [Phycisphaerae bacterium]NIP53016.1 TIR domain-containing protein [Phycisphaerae bacterium]NIS53675.1 TIR domain-containing protein [Phycisphaerae bacterium]NIU11238.1 TIR domain-containing protein [Phycisphaerae bacterium]NIU57295.1 TIR domain-containing protein [Phycisphaerae bacterium]